MLYAKTNRQYILRIRNMTDEGSGYTDVSYEDDHDAIVSRMNYLAAWLPSNVELLILTTADLSEIRRTTGWINI